MKRGTMNLIVVLAIFAVGAIAVMWESVPRVEMPASVPSVDEPIVISHDAWKARFLRGYEHELGPVEVTQMRGLFNNALIVCNYLDQGHDLPQTWRYGVDYLGMSSDQAAVVINEAQRTLCPHGAR